MYAPKNRAPALFFGPTRIAVFVSVLTLTLFALTSTTTAHDPATLAAIVRSFDAEARPKPIVVDVELYPGPVLEQMARSGIDRGGPADLNRCDRFISGRCGVRLLRPKAEAAK